MFPSFDDCERLCCEHWALVFVWLGVFISLGYAPRGGTAGPNGNFVFHYLRNRHVVFPKWPHQIVPV